jgi:hypothetical protein
VSVDLIHPVTGLRALGMGKRGPIWPVIGGNGEGGEPPTGQPPTGEPPAGTPPAANEPSGEPPAGETVDWAKEFEGMTPAEVKAALDNSRKWENRSKTNHTKATEAETKLKAVLEAAGIKTESADPEQIARDLEQATSSSRAKDIELAVLRGAITATVDPDGLTDSRSFMDKVGKLDPAADDFAEQIKTAIDEAVAARPSLKAAATPGIPSSSGGEVNGAGSPVPLQKQIDEAVKAGNIPLSISLKRRLAAASAATQ